MLSQKLNESREAPRENFGLQEDCGNWRKLCGDKSGGIMILLTHQSWGAAEDRQLRLGRGHAGDWIPRIVMRSYTVEAGGGALYTGRGHTRHRPGTGDWL